MPRAPTSARAAATVAPSSSPRCTPSAPTSRASAASSLTMKSAPRRRQILASARRLLAPQRARGADLLRYWTARRAAARSPRRPCARQPRGVGVVRRDRVRARSRGASSGCQRASAGGDALVARRRCAPPLPRAPRTGDPAGTGPCPGDTPCAAPATCIPAPRARLPDRSRPLASMAAMAEASVQPDPWYEPGSRGQLSVRTTPLLPYSVLTTSGVFSCVPVTSTYSQPVSMSLAAHCSSVRVVVVVAFREEAHLEAVGREDRRLRQQQLAQRVRHVVARELVAAAGREHRIEDQRHVGIVGDDLRDRRDVLHAAEHADLERVDRHVLEQAARLVGHPVGVDGAGRLRSRANPAP